MAILTHTLISCIVKNINNLNKGQLKMIKIIYFSLCFAMCVFGLILAIHWNFLIGISITILFMIKFLLLHNEKQKQNYVFEIVKPKIKK